MIANRNPFPNRALAATPTSSAAHNATPARTRQDARLTAGKRPRPTAAMGGATGVRAAGGADAPSDRTAACAAISRAAASTLARTVADGPRAASATACAFA